MAPRLAKVGDNAVSSAEAGRMLDTLEEAIEDLRIAYEKYFLGVDRRAPVDKHGKVKAQLRQLERLPTRSTAIRFRLSGLRARLVTYEHYWNRILGQIERGTFRRDLQQRSARRAQVEAPPTHQAEPEPEPEPEALDDEELEPVAPPRSTGLRLPPPPIVASARGAGPPRPPPPPVPGMKSTEVRRLYDDLVQAKRAAGEDTSKLTVRALARKLSRELPKLRERHGGGVEFEVATVGGKVTLRARSRGG